jgi:hypothetical protein
MAMQGPDDVHLPSVSLAGRTPLPQEGAYEVVEFGCEFVGVPRFKGLLAALLPAGITRKYRYRITWTYTAAEGRRTTVPALAAKQVTFLAQDAGAPERMSYADRQYGLEVIGGLLEHYRALGWEEL